MVIYHTGAFAVILCLLH